MAYEFVQNKSVMGMGDNVFSVVSSVSHTVIAHANENAQVIFVRPVSCNIAKEVIDLIMDKIEKKELRPTSAK